jgi:hypothetical protein
MSTTVDTNGWHTVSAITYADVNKSIADSGEGPSSFSQAASDGSASVTGNFGAWSLTTGGSGPSLMMALPITGGSVVVGSNTYPITACSATIRVQASYIPQQDANLVNLVNDTTQAVSVESCLPAQANFLADASLKELLGIWLNANLAQFKAVFSTVDLDAEYETEGVEWLQPSFKGYAVAERTQSPTLDTSVFAVLNLIDNTPEPAGLVWQVSPNVIPDGADASFVLTQEKFLSHMMWVAVPAMFKDVSTDNLSDYFVIDNSGTRIRNTKTVKLGEVKLDNGNKVNPEVTASNFTIQLDQTELEIAVTDMQFEYSSGMTVHLNYSGRATLGLDTDNMILTLSVTTQSGSGSVETSTAIQDAELVLGIASIVLAVVGAVGGAVATTADAAVTGARTASLGAATAAGEDAGQAATVTVSICKGLITGSDVEISQLAARLFTVAKVAAIGAFCTTLMPGITATMQYVANKDYASMPKITSLTNAAVGKTVIWPESVGSFTLASTQLNGACQFGLVHATT